MTERDEVSRQEVEVFRVLSAQPDTWQSNREIAAACTFPVAHRTVRAMTSKFVKLNLVDQADVFPAHKFKLATKAAQRQRGYLDRLRQAANVFGCPF